MDDKSSSKRSGDEPKFPRIERVDPENVRSNPRFKSAHPHRCNPALEAIFDGLADEHMTWREWRGKVGLFAKCMMEKKE